MELASGTGWWAAAARSARCPWPVLLQRLLVLGGFAIMATVAFLCWSGAAHADPTALVPVPAVPGVAPVTPVGLRAPVALAAQASPTAPVASLSARLTAVATAPLPVVQQVVRPLAPEPAAHPLALAAPVRSVTGSVVKYLSAASAPTGRLAALVPSLGDGLSAALPRVLPAALPRVLPAALPRVLPAALGGGPLASAVDVPVGPQSGVSVLGSAPVAGPSPHVPSPHVPSPHVASARAASSAGAAPRSHGRGFRRPDAAAPASTSDRDLPGGPSIPNSPVSPSGVPCAAAGAGTDAAAGHRAPAALGAALPADGDATVLTAGSRLDRPASRSGRPDAHPG